MTSGVNEARALADAMRAARAAGRYKEWAAAYDRRRRKLGESIAHAAAGALIECTITIGAPGPIPETEMDMADTLVPCGYCQRAMQGPPAPFCCRDRAAEHGGGAS